MKASPGLAVIPLLWLAPPPQPREDVELVRRPAAGEVVTRTFERTTELGLVEMRSTFYANGEERGSRDMSDAELRVERTLRVVLTDEVLEVDGDERVRSLRRTFDEILEESEQEFTLPDGQGDSRSSEGLSELEGTTVVFTWDDDDEEYRVAFEDEDGDEELLEGLEMEASFAAFLPDGPVAVGDTWDLDERAYLLLSDPGGDLSIEDEDEEDGDSTIDEELREALEAEGSAELIAVEELDGRRVARIAFQLTGTSEGSEEREMDGEREGTIERTLRIELGLEGELLWDVAAGRGVRVDAQGEMTMSEESTSAFETPRGDIRIEQERVIGGTSTWVVEIE